MEVFYNHHYDDFQPHNIKPEFLVVAYGALQHLSVGALQLHPLQLPLVFFPLLQAPAFVLFLTRRPYSSSGPLQMLFLLPGTFFPRHPHPQRSDISSERASLATPPKIASPSSRCFFTRLCPSASHPEHLSLTTWHYIIYRYI